MPERFDIHYIDNNNEKQRPVMLHRTIFGSIERFIGILIEHFAGKFPLWLSPVQVKILPISDKFADYAYEVQKELKNLGIRVNVDARAEKIGFKIREAQLEKVPYMLVIGEKEVENNTIAVRSRDLGDLGSMKKEEVIEKFVKEIEEKKIITPKED